MLTKEPTTVSDIIFGNDESRMRIEDIITGAEPLPSAGKCAILLYGIYGTGKTTLAKMLPEAIEQGKAGQELAMSEEFFSCQQGWIGTDIMKMIDKITNTRSFNKSELHYIILDEVDNLTEVAQRSLKSSLNTDRAIFILTTNHVSTLDRGLLDRCISVEMNAARDIDYLPMARQIAADNNVVLNDSALLPVIKAAKGSIRNIAHNVNRLARRHAVNSILTRAVTPMPNNI